MSLQTITEINLDVNQPGVSIVHAKQYDTVRQVKAHLFYNGVKWLVPSSNFEAVVGFKKADRIGGFYDATESGETAITVDSSDRSIIYVLLDRNVVTTAGNVNTEITFYDTITTGRLSTFSFITQVEEATVTELDLSSNPYFNVLADDIKAVLEAVESIAGIDATATGQEAGTSPTVVVTGGTSREDPYILHFGIPKGDDGDTATVVSTSTQYAISTNGNTPPSSGWVNNLSDIPVSDRKEKILWIKTVRTWSGDTTTTDYSASYNGGDASGAVISINGRDGVVTLSMADIFTAVGNI